jgi:hypothetical protein
MIRMIDRHAVHALKKASLPTKQIAQQMGVSERSVQRIAKEPAVDPVIRIDLFPSAADHSAPTLSALPLLAPWRIG